MGHSFWELPLESVKFEITICAIQKDKEFKCWPWCHEVVLQWQLVASDLWREMFSEDSRTDGYLTA